MAKKAVQKHVLKNRRFDGLRVVIVKEFLGAKGSARHIGLNRRALYLVYGGKRVALTSKQGAEFLSALNESKQPDYALDRLFKILRKPQDDFDLGIIASIAASAFKFDRIKTGRYGKRAVLSFNYKLLFQSGDDKDKQEKPQNPGSLDTEPTCHGSAEGMF